LKSWEEERGKRREGRGEREEERGKRREGRGEREEERGKGGRGTRKRKVIGMGRRER
jgi:hypothetical protein